MKKRIKIGENLSSGAEKVESLTKGETPQNVAATQAATSTGMPSAAMQNTSAYREIGKEAVDIEDGLHLTPAQKEARAARRRVQLAVAKKQLEEQKEAYKREKEKRAQNTSFKAKDGGRDEGKDKKEGDGGEKSSKEEPPKRAPGFGGWLAAVVALGATTLALTTVLAVGATTMTKEKKKPQ